MNEKNVQEIDDIDFSPDSMKAASISKDRLVIFPLFERFRQITDMKPSVFRLRQVYKGIVLKVDDIFNIRHLHNHMQIPLHKI